MIFHWRHYHFSRIDSTQTFAKHFFACLLPRFSPQQGFLFTADAQTAGQGTHHRPWHSPKDVNLYATFGFWIAKTQKTLLPFFAQLATLSVAQVLEGYGLDPKIKWINDLLLDNRKVGGILCESFGSRQDPDRLVILMGLGLNVNMGLADCEQIDQPVSSLMLNRGGLIVDREVLLTKIVGQWSRNLFYLLQEGFEDFKEPLKARLRKKDLSKILS